MDAFIVSELAKAQLDEAVAAVPQATRKVVKMLLAAVAQQTVLVAAARAGAGVVV